MAASTLNLNKHCEDIYRTSGKRLGLYIESYKLVRSLLIWNLFICGKKLNMWTVMNSSLHHGPAEGWPIIKLLNRNVKIFLFSKNCVLILSLLERLESDSPIGPTNSFSLVRQTQQSKPSKRNSIIKPTTRSVTEDIVIWSDGRCQTNESMRTVCVVITLIRWYHYPTGTCRS